MEPGGNYWEIESYEGGAKKHGLSDAIASPWRSRFSDSRFPDRGYVPQCLSHGTTFCGNLEKARSFYRSALGLEVMHPFPDADPYYIKHPASPWYIVCLQMPGKSRVPSSARERFTLALESADAVAAAHRWLSENAASLEVAPPAPLLEESKDLSFLLSDPDGNCWEIIAAAS